jgi:hypothetical protein
MKISYPRESTGRDEFVRRIFGCAGEDTSAVFGVQRAGHPYTSSSSVWVHKTRSIRAQSMQVSGHVHIIPARARAVRDRLVVAFFRCASVWRRVCSCCHGHGSLLRFGGLSPLMTWTRFLETRHVVQFDYRHRETLSNPRVFDPFRSESCLYEGHTLLEQSRCWGW